MDQSHIDTREAPEYTPRVKNPPMDTPTQAFLAARGFALRLRWFGLGAFLIAIIISRFLVPDDLTPFLILIAVEFAELLLATWLHRRWTPSRSTPQGMRLFRILAHGEILVELVLIAALVHLTGGIESPFLPVVLVYLFADGVVNSTKETVFHGAFLIAVLVVVVYAEYTGYWPHPQFTFLTGKTGFRDWVHVATQGVGYLVLIVLALFISASIARQFGQREAELEGSAFGLAARVRELDALREISSYLAGSPEIPTVLDRIGESALKLVNASDAHIFLYDAPRGDYTSGVGVWADGRRGLVVARPRREGGLSAEVVRTGKPVIINDAANHPFFTSDEARTWNVKAIAGFPIRKADEVLGVLNVAHLEPRTFGEDQVRVLGLLADQAALAIHNARLYTQLQTRVQGLTALHQVSMAIARLADAPGALNDALEIVARALNSQAAVILHSGVARGTMPLFAQAGLTDESCAAFAANAIRLDEGLAGQVLAKGELMTWNDLGEAESTVREAGMIEGTRAVVGVPLRVADRTFGVLELAWNQVHLLSPDDRELLLTIGQQCAVAMQNLELYNETRRRADEMATLRAIGLDLTSSVRLREQLNLLYEKVAQFLHPDTFVVTLYDERRHQIQVELVIEEGWLLRGPLLDMDEGGLTAWIIENQKPLNVPDLQGLNVELPAAPRHQTRPARSWLGVPLIAQDRTIGVLSLQSFQPNAFSVDDERFLTAVAQHTALAVGSARLFGETERRARELALINEIGRAITASLDLPEILRRTARLLNDLLGYHMATVLTLADNHLTVEAYTGYQNLPRELPLDRGVVGRVARTGQRVFLTNAPADPDYVPIANGVVAMIAVPIMAEGRVLGVISVEDARPGNLSDQDTALLSLVADQLGVAMLNAESYQAALSREHFATALGRAGMALGSTLNLKRVCELICRESVAMLQVSGAAVWLSEEDRLAWRAGFGEGVEALQDSAISISDPEALLATAIRQERGVFVNQAEKTRVVVPDWHVSAALVTPLLKEKQVIGGIVLYHVFPQKRFSAEDLNRLTIFGAQAALAISNAQLYERLQRLALQDASLYEVGLALGSTLDLQEQLGIVYQQVKRNLAHDSFYVALLNEKGDEVFFPIYFSGGRRLEPFSRPLDEQSLTGWILNHQQPLVFEDVAHQAPRLGLAPPQTGTIVETASYFGCPLLVQGKAIGVLSIQRHPPRPITQDELSFLLSLSREVAIAVSTANLLDRLRQRVDELHRTQTRLVASERRAAIGELAAGIAHEINNPLTAIIGHAQLLSLQNLPPDVLQGLDTVYRAARRIANIIKVFVHFAQPGEMRDERVDLLDVFSRALETNLPSAQDRGVSWEIVRPQSPVTAQGDPNLLYQVASALVMNALEAMPHGGHLEIWFEPGLTQVTGYVRDTGVGIAAGDLVHVFEPGFTTKVEGGTIRGLGLGLYASQQIVHALGGEIRLTSEIGAGTTAILELPSGDETSRNGK